MITFTDNSFDEANEYSFPWLRGACNSDFYIISTTVCYPWYTCFRRFSQWAVELLSQRVSSQQSQIQASQTVDVPLSRSTEPHKSEISRSVTLVQTERIDLLPDDKLKSEHVDDQISAIEKARKRELERQAEEREKKQREREEFEQKEKEKIEQRVRRTELQKIENDKKVKEKQNRHDQEEHERANKAKQESTNSISSMVSRSKRSAGNFPTVSPLLYRRCLA